jgi:hypothetical protein
MLGPQFQERSFHVVDVTVGSLFMRTMGFPMVQAHPDWMVTFVVAIDELRYLVVIVMHDRGIVQIGWRSSERLSQLCETNKVRIIQP